MKRISALAICLVLVVLCFAGCQEKNEYTPTGEFYVKTSPSRGDGGVAEVISLEAEHKAYEGYGDITVPMKVGLGHLPNHDEYGDDVHVHPKKQVCIWIQSVWIPVIWPNCLLRRVNY